MVTISELMQALCKVKSNSTVIKIEKPKVSRPGVHAKCKTSKLKSSKNYKKLYRGQGK
jgi:hypothetical protein